MALTPDKRRLLDGQLSFEGGEDTGRAPNRIERNQLALAVNCTFREDYIDLRPGYEQLKLLFIAYDTGSIVPDPTTQTAFEDGYFQGASVHVPSFGDVQLLLAISGRLFKLEIGSNAVSEISLDGGANSASEPQAWFKQVEETTVYQDGIAPPILYNGASAVRSDVNGAKGSIDKKPLRQVPVGRAMEYCNGRLWVSLSDRRSFVAGDIVGGPTGVLYFTENEFIAENGTFKVPANLGFITGMRSVPTLDTSLGQGPLQVVCTNGVFSCNAPPERSTWQSLTYPINSVSQGGPGGLSDRSLALVNSDLWYRSRDGIRSWQIARRDFGMWSNTALSHEVKEHIRKDNKTLLDRSSAVLFDNRLLTTCIPQYDPDHGVYHLGLVSLDFNPLTSLRAREQPAWDGMWTGLRIMQLLTADVGGINRCFAIVLSDAGKIQVWEINPVRRYDMQEDGTRLRIKRMLFTPRFDWRDKLALKEIEGWEQWEQQVSGTVDYALYYRPDQYPGWFSHQSWQQCATVERCPADAVDGCVTDLNIRPQYRPRTTAQQPAASCTTGTNNPSTVCYEAQWRLDITGDTVLTGFRVRSKLVDEDTYGPCPAANADCTEIIACEPDQVLESVP